MGKKQFQNEIEGKFVLPENVEEEAFIRRMILLRETKAKIVFFWICVLLTGGIVFLLARWILKVKKFFYTSKAQHEDCNTLIVEGGDDTFEYVNCVENRELFLDGTSKRYKTFDYRLYTYYFDQTEHMFKPIQFLITGNRNNDIIRTLGLGIQTQEILNQRAVTYGKNSTAIPERGIMTIIVDEILSPFYIFQLFSCILWGFFEEYIIYACVIAGISISSICISLWSIKKTHKRLNAQASYNIEIKVFRYSTGGKLDTTKFENIHSIDLVPGDVIEVPVNKNMPCDIYLLSGTCIMNESMLTGESIPVIKTAAIDNDKKFDIDQDAKSVLFSGTKCLETRKDNKNDHPVVGIVFKTGFSTMKGRLVRSLMYEKPEMFKFYQDALNFIGYMGLIASVLFFYSLAVKISQDAAAGDIIIKACDIITITVPPALATCNTISQEVSCTRLQESQISTKSKTKINVAGRIDVMCFDKTGTLTDDSLDFYGVRVSDNSAKNKFQKLLRTGVHQTLNIKNGVKNAGNKFLELMGSCHSLTHVQGEINGDPLELRMFKTIGWELNEQHAKGDTHQAIALPPSFKDDKEKGQEKDGYFTNANKSQVFIIQRFDFAAKLQRMGVIVKDSAESKQRVYVKGSPEKIKEICVPSSIPDDFFELLGLYTQSGLRVIACGTRLLDKDVRGDDTGLNRDEFENNLEFLGFMIFQNKLKSATLSAIGQLHHAKIPSVMITGDHALTAVCVARDCTIIGTHQTVVLGELKTEGERKSVQFRQIEVIKSANEVSTKLDFSLDDINNAEVIPMIKIEELNNSHAQILS